jgi:hypothetical protein
MVWRLIIGLGFVIGSAVASAEPRDFTPEITDTYAAVACGTGGNAEGFASAVVAKHCTAAGATLSAWDTHWRAKVAPFVAANATTTATDVLYPFGGGDLATALVVFPDAHEYTTISLEGMGDPRAITDLKSDAKGKQLAAALSTFRGNLAESFGYAWNTTADLSVGSTAGAAKTDGARVPQILGIALTALAVNGYEPLSARYFQIAADGSLAYITADEVATWDAAKHKPAGKKENDLQVGLFTNIEITFRKSGDATAPTKTFRHFAADLSNHMDPGVRAYLTHGVGGGTRPLATITKAAVYLLWRDAFTDLRDLLLARMVIMVSDDTGILPSASEPAGFTVSLWGKYHGAFFPGADHAIAAKLATYWKAHAPGALDFHFGYYDDKRQSHLMITRKKS